MVRNVPPGTAEGRPSDREEVSPPYLFKAFISVVYARKYGMRRNGIAMDYELGLNELKKLAKDTDWYEEFLVYEARLRDVLREERLYGAHSGGTVERNKIVDQLNRLMEKQHFKTSFNDLCLGRVAGTQIPVSPHTPHTSNEATTEDNTSAARNSTANIFIVYADADKRYLDEFRNHLRPFIRSGELFVEDRDRIQPGARWQEEIEQALRSTDLAVLLLSAHFLASDTIEEVELPILRERIKQQSLDVLCVIVGYCSFDASEFKHYKPLNDSFRPLSAMSQAERQKVWEKAVQWIRNVQLKK